MTAKLVKLVQPVDNPRPDLVTAATELLEHVKSGRVRALAFVAVQRGGAVSTYINNSPEGHRHELVSGSSRLVNRLHNELD
jgi:hypothetical protein